MSKNCILICTSPEEEWEPEIRLIDYTFIFGWVVWLSQK